MQVGTLAWQATPAGVPGWSHLQLRATICSCVPQRLQAAAVCCSVARNSLPALPHPCADRAYRWALQFVIQPLLGLLHCPACEQHVEAMAAHERLSPGVLELALARVRTLAVAMQLPEERRPPDCTQEAAAHTACLLEAVMLEPALERWAQAADGASTAAVIAAAAQLAQQVPLDGQRVAPLQWVPAIAVAALPGLLCLQLCQDAGLFARQNLEHRRRVAAQLLPALARLPQLLQLAAGNEQPSLSAQQLQDVVKLCGPARYHVALLCLYRQDDLNAGGQGLISSPSDAAAWAQAASAALRCVPLLHNVQAAARQAGHTAAAAISTTLTVSANELAMRAGGVLLQQASTAQGLPTAAASEVLQAAWALHTALCRRAHFAAAASGTELQLSQPIAVRQAVGTLSTCMCASAGMHSVAFCAAGRHAPSPPDARLQADRCAGWLSVWVYEEQMVLKMRCPAYWVEGFA